MAQTLRPGFQTARAPSTTAQPLRLKRVRPSVPYAAAIVADAEPQWLPNDTLIERALRALCDRDA